MLNQVRGLSRSPGFTSLVTARFISNLGNGLSPVALAYGVLRLPGSTATDLSLVMAARITPMIIFMLFGGVIGDRFKRNPIVGGTDIIGSFIASVSAISFIAGFASVPLLALMGGVFGVLNALWWPAMSGVLPDILPKESLQQGNAMIGLLSNSGFVVGALIGGTVVTLYGSGWALLVDALTFFIAGILVWRISLPPIPKREKRSIFHDLKIGWNEFISRSWVVAVVLGFTFINLCFEATISVLGPLAYNSGGQGPRLWSFNLAAAVAGMVAGGIISLKLYFSRPLLVGLLALSLTPTWILSMGLSLALPLVLSTAFIAGMAVEIFGVLWSTALQKAIPEESYSRVISYEALGSIALAPIGIAVAGPLSEWIGISRTLYAAAALTLVAALIPLTLKSVRGLNNQEKR